MPDYSIQNMRECLVESGFVSLKALLLHHPTKGYNQLSEMLHGVPPIVLVREHLALANTDIDTDLFVKDSLFRNIREGMPKGWLVNTKRQKAIILLAGWESEMIVTCGLKRLEKRLDWSVDYLLTNAPKGWIPPANDDSILNKAFTSFSEESVR